MNTNRKTAIIVGVLYIIGTISGFMSIVFTDPIRNAQDPLISVSTNENQIIFGALFVLIMGLALAMVPVTAFPILRKHNETLALGYIVFRGGLEAVRYMATTISWLLLLPLSKVYQAGTPNASNLQALGDVLLNVEEIADIGAIVFCLGALMFYYVLYRSKLIPRWLSGWGLTAIMINLAAVFLSIFGLVGQLSTAGLVLEIPIAIQEMVMAVWLIVKGFNPSAIISSSVKTELNEKK
jgi:hypothetical protein